VPDFDTSWREAPPALRRSLELAYETLAAGGLACGSVLIDAAGQIVAEGRNRAYDPPGGRDILQGTPLAHAEMNVLAQVRTEWEVADCTLWSTQLPCDMCTTAVSFIGVGRIRYVAPDPWAIVDGAGSTAGKEGPAEDIWVVTANVMFLYAIAAKRGLQHSTVAGNQRLEPETAGIVADLVTAGTPPAHWRSFTHFLSTLWPQLEAAATARGHRLS
jgi:tRNA(Arg) A34 adenosine deaminase TadA